jgi:branched-chain amino acid transport system permease protein
VHDILGQLFNGLSLASVLLLAGLGLTFTFGQMGVIHMAHGEFMMFGAYTPYVLQTGLLAGASGLAYMISIPLAFLVAGILGLVLEATLLKRMYGRALDSLLVTVGVALVLQQAARDIFGAPNVEVKAPTWLRGSIHLFDVTMPKSRLFIMVLVAVVIAAISVMMSTSPQGRRMRAVMQNRDLAEVSGIKTRRVDRATFFLGSGLAGVAGVAVALIGSIGSQMGTAYIIDAFLVVVVGGMGSIPGAYVAALLIAEVKAICIGLGTVDIFGFAISFSKLTLVVEFLVMALVLVVRPWGLMGRQLGASRNSGPAEAPLRLAGPSLRITAVVFLVLLTLVPLVTQGAPYVTVLAIDLLVAALFAASLHFIMGPAGMHSFGHAAYFGLGAYGSALLVRSAGVPMELSLILGPLIAAVGAIVFGWFCVRLSGVYLAMLTLAFAQIVWSVSFQWDEVTGGSNGITGVWPSPWLADKQAYYYATLALVTVSVVLLRRILFSPFGYAMRAGRDSPMRADALGIDVKRMQWVAFVVAALFAGLSGSLFAFSKGSISPEGLGVGRSVDGLVMVLLGGLQTLAGPLVGAVAFTWLQDFLARTTEYWRAMLGGVVLLLVIVFPMGIAGYARHLLERRTARAAQA